MVSAPNRSNDLSMLGGDDESISLDFHLKVLTVLLEYLDCLVLG